MLQQLSNFIAVIRKYRELSEEGIFDNLYLIKYSDFVDYPEKCINFLYDAIVTDNTFHIENYTVDKYRNRFIEIFENETYGYKNFFWKEQMNKYSLASHQQGLFRIIKKSPEVKNKATTKCFDRIKNETDLFQQFEEVITDYPFLKIN